MEFDNDTQRQVFEKVVTWMRELYGEQINVRENRPAVSLMHGTAYIVVSVYAWGDAEAVILTRSFVVTDVEVTEDLMHFLLRKNDAMRLGAFGLDSDDDIFFEYSLVGSSCDKNELKAAISAVATTADQYDEEIRSRWGGLRAIER